MHACARANWSACYLQSDKNTGIHWCCSYSCIHLCISSSMHEASMHTYVHGMVQHSRTWPNIQSQCLILITLYDMAWHTIPRNVHSHMYLYFHGKMSNNIDSCMLSKIVKEIPNCALVTSRGQWSKWPTYALLLWGICNVTLWGPLNVPAKWYIDVMV